MYKIAAENLQALFQKIAADQDLYLPVKVSDQVNFKAWSEDAEVCLDILKTVKSPKDAFFPQSENLYTVQNLTVLKKRMWILLKKRCFTLSVPSMWQAGVRTVESAAVSVRRVFRFICLIGNLSKILISFTANTRPVKILTAKAR